jgi:hypothetical protein
MVNSFRYKEINKSNLIEFKLPKIIPYIPSPTDTDYKRGYITRYFIQKANDSKSFIYEISSSNYNKFAISPFYTQVPLDWRILGTDDEIRNSNMKSLKIAQTKIPSIQLYLPNLLQFRKPL